MKKMKLFTLAFFCLAVMFTAASAATLSIDPATADLVKGQNVQLTLKVEDVQQLGSFDIEITWDPLVVDLSKYDITKGPSIDTLTNYTRRGSVHLAGFNSTIEGISGDADLCYLNFTGVGDTGQTTAIEVNVGEYGFLNSTYGKKIPYTANDGSITAQVSNTIDARIGVAGRTVPADKETTVKASVANQRNYDTSKLNIAVKFTNKDNGTEVQNLTYPDVVISPGAIYSQDIAWTPDAGGNYLINISVTSEDALKGRISDEKSINVVDYELDIVGEKAYGYSRVRAGNGFYFYFRAEANKAGNVNLNVDAPDGIEVSGGEKQTRYLYNSKYNYVYVWMRSTDPGTFTSDDFNFTLSANGKTDSIKGRDLTVYVPSIEVESVGAASVSDDAGKTTNQMTFNTLHTDNTNRNSTVLVAQSGARGRTLSGLGYLVGYPYGCVEQTTAQMLASLNVKNYYLNRDDKPANFGDIREDANNSVSSGVDRLVMGGVRGQHTDPDQGAGGWSLWGYGDSESSSSSYAGYGLAKVNMPGEDLNRLLDGKILHNESTGTGKVNFDMLIEWFNENHDSTTGAPWSWSAPVCHSWTSESNTAFVMLIHDMINQSVEVQEPYYGYMIENMQNATIYLVNKYDSVGTGALSDGDDAPMATALGLWGLEVFGVPTEGVVSQEKIDEVKAGTKEYLLNNQNAKGFWSAKEVYGWYNKGRVSESTAYALLALNATGVPNDNETITKGVAWLVDTYESSGSWGYTWATQSAIDALIVCQGSVVSTGTVDVSIDGNYVYTFTLTNTKTRDTYPLNSGQMETMMASGVKVRDVLSNGEVDKHTVELVHNSGEGQILISVENTQWAPLNEIDSNISDSRTIQEVDMDGGAELMLFNRNIDILNEVDEDVGKFTLLFSNPSPLEVGEEGEVTISVKSEDNLFSPMIEVPIVDFTFDNESKIKDQSNNDVSYELLNSTALANRTSVFIQPEQWVNKAEHPDAYSYTFKLVPDDYGTLNMSFRIIPLNDDMNVAITTHNFDVTGKGNVTINVQDENYEPVVAESITVNGETVSDKSSYNFIGLSEGSYLLNVKNKNENYPDVHGNVSVRYGKVAEYNVTMPTSMDKPVLLLSEGDTGSIAGSSHTPGVLSALKKENMTYNVSVMGEGGELGIGLEFPVRYMMNDPVVKLNGVVLGEDEYELTPGTFECGDYPVRYSTTNSTLVVYNSTSGTNYLELGFEGDAWGDSDENGVYMFGAYRYVTASDASDIAEISVGVRKWDIGDTTWSTYDYVDIDRDGLIMSSDAMLAAQQAVVIVDEYYNPK